MGEGGNGKVTDGTPNSPDAARRGHGTATADVSGGNNGTLAGRGLLDHRAANAG
ncbi:hypothetical protein QQY66_25790 [Streptomyces sp. DG2A-72]|uniref:hypothetical protein n=1 Tax=Streptomyces sp. DG2A-72 TaxID=3051386 RepID=UPI00265C4E64|nr:hypothetical protein [Streptomyces sp. DG2A-72]MDO0934918.1 hypothetical protein [Streptomyces sp. DG2A-72]